ASTMHEFDSQVAPGLEGQSATSWLAGIVCELNSLSLSPAVKAFVEAGHRFLPALCAAARAPRGATQPAAPLSATSNSRRPMVTVIRPSRARCVKGTIPRHERAVPNSAASKARAGSLPHGRPY